MAHALGLGYSPAHDSPARADSYLAGNRFSAADICVGYQLYWLTLWPEFKTVMRDFPRILEYLERLQKRPLAVKAEVFSYPG